MIRLSGEDKENPRIYSVSISTSLQQTFLDLFLACLGEASYHAMSRPRVMVKHEFKKPYVVALQQAVFAWRPDLFSELKKILGAKGF
jgi:hypothetical protein